MRYLRGAVLLCLAAASLSAQSPSSDLLLILDASGSMWGQIEGKNKIVIARETLREVADKIPAGVDAGLIAYGHRREGDCGDIETIARLGDLDKAGLIAAVDEINPKGKTPITAAIEQGVEVANGHGQPTTIILLSDGIETCGGDPCAAVAEAKRVGSDFLLHVIGFDMGAEDVAALECAAQAGGGMYFDARNAADLAAAFDRVVVEEDEAQPDSAISVRAIRNGRLTDVAVTVRDADGAIVGGGRTYEHEGTNPRRIPLPAGTYSVEATAVGIRGAATVRFDEVAVPQGETVEKVVDLSTGVVTVKVTRNGELGDATLRVYEAGTNTQVAAGRTYTGPNSNPKMLDLIAGKYDIVVESVEISGSPEQRWEGVVVEPSARTDLEHEFASGELKIGAQRGGALVDSTVNVVRAGESTPIAAGRTYTAATSNPRTFTVAPGKYLVRISPVRVPGASRQEIEVEVSAGALTERTIEF